MGYKLYEKLKEAYETTTRSHNRFKEEIEKINWDNKFEADGEIYFMKDGVTLTIENMNPFEQRWKPSMIFKDGSLIEF